MRADNSYQTRQPGRGGRFGIKAGLSAGALILSGSLIGWSASAIGAGSSPAPAPAAAPISAPAVAAARTIGAGGDTYAPLVEQVAPAVVTVTSERRVRTTSSQLPDDPLLRQFFGDQFRGRRMPPQERREGGLGSGVIVRPDGYILTNNHVVDGADQVKVELTDGRTFTAKVVGTDAPSDLAVLKVDGSNLHTLQLADSEKVRVGDVALAVGNPLGIGQTVTMGIISAKGRATANGAEASYQDFIQTDAPINQGNSGGALVNTQGELIGINSQILSTSGGNIGIGFAIPANMARNVMSQLIDHGSVRRGLLGVSVQSVTADIARSLNIENAHGALVSNVTAGGAADKAGLRRGDVITAINGSAVKDTNGLRNEVAQMLPGTDAKVTILREGKEQTVNVRLGERESARAEADGPRDAASGGRFGLAVEPLTRDTARQLGVSAATGVVVTSVEPSSRAADAGLREGDVIEEVDGVKVTTGDALRTALNKSSAKPALLLVHRGDNTIYVPLERGQ
jgi:Do/DeqQ family serine protease